ncbi:MAG: TldD/PmbA family protein [Pseudomonadaceae bacterium]|nr:TldD/PmbA family protein [Pseudomonadaceae bacterium]
MTINPKSIAESALEQLQAAGFDDAHVSVSITAQDELNIEQNEASLLRSIEDYDISLTGILDGRKASVALTDLNDAVIAQTAKMLIARARSAPQDDANAVSSDQVCSFEQGPLDSDLDLLCKKASEILDFRATQAPKVEIRSAAAAHGVSRSHVVTTRGTALSSTVGSLRLSVTCNATEDGKTSSFSYSGGIANDLSAKNAVEFFALDELMLSAERQIQTRLIEAPFVGAVILAPSAVSSVVNWLLEQLGTQALIAQSSVYQHSVGEQIAASGLTLRSDFDAPGHTPYTGDGFRAEPLVVLENGKLATLLPDLYGSLKTGLSHHPSTSGWSIDAGQDKKADLISSVKQGALVTRISMGRPTSSGDFSGVIKNSFLIEDGKVGTALAETMVAGNMTQMLKDIDGVSTEKINYGGQNFPWLKIPGMHFS